MKPLVFIPVDPAAALALRESGAQPTGPAYAATAALRETFGYGAGADEEADYMAQLLAALAGLVAGWDRCVLAVEVTSLPSGTGALDIGEVTLPRLRWVDVVAVFVDEPGARPAVQAYAQAARGRGVADLWADPATQEFLSAHPLLWFAPSELDQALAGLSGDPTTKGD